ncbi:zinc ribbon domain-containing protein [Desulfomonile tiedjei]|uniref:Putative zinc ribbon domain-containing protein n=1 Tax=Desulfomonile tiedjei (strain ATCC 49306 / DSM 6799 / DCB-1) TaxID=706587 RepID=I4C9B0_DESTA|nr:zinc ribbon domain-containing protein [Desulfomonile tiedjei]AFM26151.1 hypothetical protein Desti_3500 [Desulfomonile tiedjei DSM 6799]
MDKFCYSCGAPLDMPDFKGISEDYCKFCIDEQGSIKPRDEIQAVVAEWLKTWQPNLNDKTALERAASYMKAMPAWAD